MSYESKCSDSAAIVLSAPMYYVLNCSDESNKHVEIIRKGLWRNVERIGVIELIEEKATGEYTLSMKFLQLIFRTECLPHFVWI